MISMFLVEVKLNSRTFILIAPSKLKITNYSEKTELLKGREGSKVEVLLSMLGMV